MKLLAFDTSTEVLSVAVCRDGADGAPVVWAHSGAGGAQASSTLIPTVMTLLAQAGLRLDELDAIAFGAGPGSFTGLRTACSVAQGLGFGAKVPLLPIDTLLAVAEEVRHQHRLPAAPTQVLRVQAALDARMDEMYVARFAFDSARWTMDKDCELIRPEDLEFDPATVLAGNVASAYGARLGVAVMPALPTATAMLRLAPALLAAGLAVSAEQALPRYVRDKVAKTTDERAAEKAVAC